MNAEYERHEHLLQLLKPKVNVGIERPGRLESVPSVTLAPVPESLAWSLEFMDPAALAHGVKELTSPLSE